MILYNKNEIQDLDELDYIVSMIEIDLKHLLKSRNTYKVEVQKYELNDCIESITIKCEKLMKIE